MNTGDTITNLSQAVDDVIGSHWEKERKRCAQIVVDECLKTSKGCGAASAESLTILLLGQAIYRRIMEKPDVSSL